MKAGIATRFREVWLISGATEKDLRRILYDRTKNRHRCSSARNLRRVGYTLMRGNSAI